MTKECEKVTNEHGPGHFAGSHGCDKLVFLGRGSVHDFPLADRGMLFSPIFRSELTIPRIAVNYFWSMFHRCVLSPDFGLAGLGRD